MYGAASLWLFVLEQNAYGWQEGLFCPCPYNTKNRGNTGHHYESGCLLAIRLVVRRVSWPRSPLPPESLCGVDQGFRVAIPVREDKLRLGIVGLRGGHWSFSIFGGLGIGIQ